MRSTEGMCLSDDVNFPRRYAVSANAHDSVSVTLNFCVPGHGGRVVQWLPCCGFESLVGPCDFSRV